MLLVKSVRGKKLVVSVLMQMDENSQYVCKNGGNEDNNDKPSCDHDHYCKEKDDDIHQYVCKNGGKQGIKCKAPCDEYCKEKDDSHQYVCKNRDEHALDGLINCEGRSPHNQQQIVREEALIASMSSSSNGDDDGLHGNTEEESVEYLSIDEVLRKWVGEFGRAQMAHFTLTSLAWALEALHTLVTIFADKTPPWRCTHTHKISHNGVSYVHSNASNGTVDSSYNSSFDYMGDGGRASCTPSSSLCSLAPSQWEWIRKDESTVSQWNLVCESSYMQGLAQSFFFIGCLIGAGIFGHLSDSRLGRRGALMLACLLSAAWGMLTAASPSYAAYILMRAATGICSGGLGLTSFVLGTEMIGPSRRTSVAMSALYFYPFGLLLLAALATSTSHCSWRLLYIVTSAPSVLYCLFILPFLAESPRWYLVRGRPQDALRMLKAVARRNGTVIPAKIVLRMDEQYEDDPEHVDLHPINVAYNTSNSFPQIQERLGVMLESSEMQQFHAGAPLTSPPSMALGNGAALKQEINEVAYDEAKKVQSKAASGTLMDVFRGDDSRLRMVILVVVWFASALGYYAFNLNVGNLGTNLTISVVLNALAEVPGYAITTCLLSRVGRRITLIAALLLTACSSLVGATVSYKLNAYHTFRHGTYNVSASSQSTYPLIGVPFNASHANSLINTSTPFYPSPHHIHNLQLHSSIQLVCALVGLFSIAGTYNLLYLYTSELFPTVVRNAALGLATQAGSIGSIIAPIVAISAHVNSSFPFFIIGAVSLAGGLMAVKLPETLNRPFHETLEGMRRTGEQA